MTCSTSEVADCCSSDSARLTRASARSRLQASSCCSKSACGSRLRPTLVLAFVAVERSLRSRVPVFTPFRDKVTSAARRSTQTSPRPPAPKNDSTAGSVCEGIYVGATNGNRAAEHPVLWGRRACWSAAGTIVPPSAGRWGRDRRTVPNVRCWHKADVRRRLLFVRFRGQSGLIQRLRTIAIYEYTP